MCDEIHPEHGIRCRIDGPHPDHLFGYGKATFTWPNPDFRPLVQRIPRNKLVELAQRTREFNAS